MLLFESCVAFKLARFVFDFARFDKLAVGFERCLNQSVVQADKKVSFFDDIANPHRNVEDSCSDLRGEEDGVELLQGTASSDDFFQRLSAHRNGFHGRRRMHEARLSSVRADHVKDGFKHEQTKQATDDQEDHTVGTSHRIGFELETARDAVSRL
jgi:hypothetical protein